MLNAFCGVYSWTRNHVDWDLALRCAFDALSQEGNADASAICWLMSLASGRSVWWCLEQPPSSTLCCFEAVCACFTSCGAHVTFTWLGAFGASTAKPVQLWSTMPASMVRFYLRRTMERSRQCLALRAQMTGKPKVKLMHVVAKKTKGNTWSRTHWFQGKGGLSLSKEYPGEFCESVASLFGALDRAMSL